MHILILMRHGEAESVAPTDAERNLTAVGRTDVDRTANLLFDTCPEIDRMIVSPYTRARQTAGIVSEVYGGIEQVVSNAVVPEASPQTASAAIEALLENVDTGMVVFHQPIISRLVYYLACEDLTMRTASAAVLLTPVLARGCCEIKCVI